MRSIFFAFILMLIPMVIIAENPFLKRFPLQYERVEGEEKPHYSLNAAHLPRNEEMLLMTRRLNGTSLMEIQEVYTNDKGDIVSTFGGITPYVIAFNGVARGEPVELIVVPKNQYLNRNKRKPVAAIGSIVVQPIEVEDESGHSLSLYVASADGMNFLVSAKGFFPREKIDAIVRTERGEVKLRARATKEGTFGASIAPAPVGIKEGTFAFELRGSTTNALFIDHVFGQSAFHN